MSACLQNPRCIDNPTKDITKLQREIQMMELIHVIIDEKNLFNIKLHLTDIGFQGRTDERTDRMEVLKDNVFC